MNKLRNRLKSDFSQIPNEMITDMDLSAGALRVLLYLFTKPDNWNVYNKDICKQLSISEQTLTKYWKILLTSKWLRRERSQDESGKLQGGYIYRIGTFDRIHTNTVSIHSTETVKSIDHSNNKPIKKQETNTNTNLPEWLNLDIWEEWVQHRKEIHKKLTPSTIKKQISFLSKHKQQHIEIINQSIMNGWAGLFEIKQHKVANNPTHDAIDKYFENKPEVIDV